MKRTILIILQRSRDLICNDSYIFNIMSLIAVSIIIYKFIRGLSFDIGLLSLIISFVISFAISNFVLDKFKYSENKYIRFIQKFLIYNIILIVVSFVFFYVLNIFNLISTVHCCSNTELNKEIKDKELVVFTSSTDQSGKKIYNLKMDGEFFDNGVKNIGVLTDTAVDKIVPNLGIGAAAGTAAAAAIKSTAGMPLGPRLITVGGNVLTTAATTKIGMEIGSAIVQHSDITEMIKNSPHADPQHDRIPSPDSSIINSPLENDIFSPLQDLLLWSFVLDIFILILLTGILLIIFNRYITKYNLNFINSTIIKYMPIKIRNWFNKSTDTGIDYNNKLVLFIFIINTIVLFFVVFLKLLIISTLWVDIDSFIMGHNYIHGKESSIILFMSSAYKYRFINTHNFIRYFNSQNNKDLNTSNNSLNKMSIVNSEKFSRKDMLDIYSYGITNPDKIKDQPEFLEIIEVLSKRITRSNTKLLGGYKEVAFFREIIFLEDKIEIDEDLNQDHVLNEEYEIYNM